VLPIQSVTLYKGVIMKIKYVPETKREKLIHQIIKLEPSYRFTDWINNLDDDELSDQLNELRGV